MCYKPQKSLKGYNLHKLPACRDDIKTKPHSSSHLRFFKCWTCGRMPEKEIRCHFVTFNYDAIYFTDTDSFSTGWRTKPTLASLLFSSYFFTKLSRLCMKNIPNAILSCLNNSTLLSLFLVSKSLPLALEGRLTFLKSLLGPKNYHIFRLIKSNL